MTKETKIDFYNIPIVDYLLMIGEPIVSVGRNYYQHREHDSLKINKNKNYFVWNSRSSEKNARGGVVQYLQIVKNLSLKQALDKIEYDLSDKDLKAHKTPEKAYPKEFNYKVKEKFTSLQAQKYLVTKRRLPNKIVKEFFNNGLISQNDNQEIIFKWFQGNEIVGFTKQGTVPLTEEEKEKYHTKRDFFKYVAPTTEEFTYWGFNYLKGLPKNIYFFEAPIDLLSYYAIHEKELTNDFWLISTDGVAVALEKIFAFLKYAIENLNLIEVLESLNVCFDNDTSGLQAFEEISKRTIKDIEFTKDFPVSKDWNNDLQLQKEGN